MLRRVGRSSSTLSAFRDLTQPLGGLFRVPRRVGGAYRLWRLRDLTPPLDGLFRVLRNVGGAYRPDVPRPDSAPRRPLPGSESSGRSLSTLQTLRGLTPPLDGLLDLGSRGSGRGLSTLSTLLGLERRWDRCAGSHSCGVAAAVPLSFPAVVVSPLPAPGSCPALPGTRRGKSVILLGKRKHAS